MLDSERKFGVKLTIINEMDYEDMKQIAELITGVGYKITIVDNGNWVISK